VRHQKKGRRLGVQPDHRRLLLSNLACSVLEHGRVKTTESRAKEVKPLVEKAITLGKSGELHHRRQAISLLRNKKISYALFNEIAPRYADRPGGYTRILKLGPRLGDAAPMVYLELVEE
jgi:large subunit ribosomal protein L17